MEQHKRIFRRKRTGEDLGIKSSGGLFDLIDNAVKEMCRINDEEYDFICLEGEDELLSYMTMENFSFRDKRRILTLLEETLKKYNEVKA